MDDVSQNLLISLWLSISDIDIQTSVISGCRYRISISEPDTDIYKRISDMWISVSGTVDIGYCSGP